MKQNIWRIKQKKESGQQKKTTKNMIIIVTTTAITEKKEAEEKQIIEDIKHKKNEKNEATADVDPKVAAFAEDTATNLSGCDKNAEATTLLIGTEKAKATTSATLLGGDLKAVEANTATNFLGEKKKKTVMKKQKLILVLLCSVAI